MKEKVKAKKLLAVISSLALILQLVLSAFPQIITANEEEKVTFDVTYSTEEVKRGDEITVAVQMPENNGQALEAELQYDSEKLELVTKAQGDGLNGANGDTAFADVTSLDGKVKVVAILMNVDTHFKGGEILNVTFKVKDTAAVGEAGIKFVVNELAYESKTEVEGQLDPHTITGIVSENADVMVIIPLTSLVLDKTSVALTKGETTTLTVEQQPEDAIVDSFIWISSNSEVATVKDGVVTAKKEGTTVIT